MKVVITTPRGNKIEEDITAQGTAAIHALDVLIKTHEHARDTLTALLTVISMGEIEKARSMIRAEIEFNTSSAHELKKTLNGGIKQ